MLVKQLIWSFCQNLARNSSKEDPVRTSGKSPAATSLKDHSVYLRSSLEKIPSASWAPAACINGAVWLCKLQGFDVQECHFLCHSLSLLFIVLGIYNFAWPSVEYRFSSTEDLACLRSPLKVSMFISESVPWTMDI